MALITEAQLNMANLNEEPVWEEGIYQFETTDPVEGGPEGIDNKPTRQLANRTAYLKEEQGKIKEEVLLLNQQWSENANYGIGHEAVRNGLRYIARAASGPDNGGAVMPTNDDNRWHPVFPSAYSERDESSSWIKIAVVNGVQNLGGGGDFLSLEFIGWSDFGYTNRFSADIMVVERNDAFSAIVLPKTLGIQNPTFYTKRVSANNFELWVKRNSTFPCPLTVIRKSRSRYAGTIAGILEKATTEPTGLTIVPYDTGYQFSSIPIGMEVAFDTPPPTNDPRFRFVKLTYNDAYNTGLLTSQTLSGSAPELVSTAVISAAQSPINGQTINMINTMGTFIRPGVTAGVRKSSQNKAHTHTQTIFGGNDFSIGLLPLATDDAPGGQRTTAYINDSGGDESNPYCESRVFYKRIW
ncbi:tail fiber protein [Vibrio cholerae AM-19226]|nr:tail fiber protein [Vibrio cholerae AM-19226]